MADPMTALSIAAAAVQFVDFSWTILKLCREIRKSAKDATDTNAEIESSVGKLQEYQKRLRPFEPTQGVSQKDVSIIEHARQDCNDTADKLLKVLQDLKPKNRRWFGAVAWAAWRAHRAGGKIQSLEKQLEGRNTRFREALTDVTWERVFHLLEEQKDILREQLLPKVEQMHDESKAAHSRTHDKLEKAQITADQKDFLAKLSFTEMSQRHENIEPPATGTFEWIFTDTFSLSEDSSQQQLPDNSSQHQELQGAFMRWLTSDEKVFWISGKAGSGKSSLMAYIESHRRLEGGLKQWSRGRPLTVLNFFFWQPGADLQKSVTGLLRSLLHQLFTSRPLAINEVCAKDPALRKSDWTEERLSRSLNDVLDFCQRANECVFFLIDGLDEFEGDYSRLLKIILPVKLRSNVKICLSSRPLEIFQQHLLPCATIRLEDLNYRDIKHYVTSKLEGLDYPHKDHITDIPRRAEGIFLWAALVTKELIGCYQEDHTEATLRTVLNDMPQGLAPLFNSLFSRVDRRSHDFLLLIFQVLKNPGTSWAVDLACITACLHHKDASSLHDFLDHCQKVHRQIALRSKGLIEVDSTRHRQGTWTWRGWALEDPSIRKPRQAALTDDETQNWMTFAWPRVHWLHRSAYDYIFNSLKPDLPIWIREINITQDVLDGSAWLLRYGILISGHDRYAPLVSDVEKLTTYFLSQVDMIPDVVCQSLDNLCGILESYLSEESWLDLDVRAYLGYTKEISCSLIAQTLRDFWTTLAREEFYDYIVSRFNLVKSGRFAHLMCCTLLYHVGESPQLMRLVLDTLVERARSQVEIAEPNTREIREYRHSPANRLKCISWRTHGEIDESTSMTDLENFIPVKYVQVLPGMTQLFPDPFREQDFPREVPASLLPGLIALLDHWELFSVPRYHLHAHLGKMWPLEVHYSLSDAVRSFGTDSNEESSISLRLLGSGKNDGGQLQLEHIGLVPICLFHTSPVTNATLLNPVAKSTATGKMFKGSLTNFLECLEILLKDVREDAADQLNVRQQRYLLVLIQIYFVVYWDIEDWKEFACGDDDYELFSHQSSFR